VVAGRQWTRSTVAPGGGPVVRSQIDLTAERPLRSPGKGNHPVSTELAVSPDGGLLVWTSRPDDGSTPSALHMRRLDTGEVTRIQGTEGAFQPFISPDGRWIGFSVREGVGKYGLRRVPIEGGLAADLAELPWPPSGASWEADGTILLGSEVGGIRWVPAEGGAPRELTTANRTREFGHRLPSALPGGRSFVFTTIPALFGVRARIEAVSLPGGERKLLVEDGADARYLATGHLVFVRRGVVMAAPFDPERLELTAPPVPVVQAISQALNAGDSGDNSGAAQIAVSETGLLAYASGGIYPDTPIELLLVDEGGRTEPLPGFDKPLVSPQLQFSPDGRQMVFIEQARSGLLWLFDVERHTYQVLSDRGIASSPRWSPDGTRLVFGWTEAGPFHLWLRPTDRGNWQQLTSGEQNDIAPFWSPDGRVLAFLRGGDVFLYRFEDKQVLPFLTTKAEEGYSEFSPDGRWLAYASNETGRSEIHVTSFPDRERTRTVSDGGGSAPAWSHDGSRLFYYSPPSADGRHSMMAVAVRPGAELSRGRPAALFRLPDRFVSLSPVRSYDLHPDGRHFVMGRYVEGEPEPPITRLELVHNWFAELERLCPTGR